MKSIRFKLALIRFDIWQWVWYREIDLWKFVFRHVKAPAAILRRGILNGLNVGFESDDGFDPFETASVMADEQLTK